MAQVKVSSPTAAPCMGAGASLAGISTATTSLAVPLGHCLAITVLGWQLHWSPGPGPAAVPSTGPGVVTMARTKFDTGKTAVAEVPHSEESELSEFCGLTGTIIGSSMTGEGRVYEVPVSFRAVPGLPLAPACWVDEG